MVPLARVHTNPLRAAWIVLLQLAPRPSIHRLKIVAVLEVELVAISGTPDPKLPAMHAGLPGRHRAWPRLRASALRTERGVVRQPEEIVDAIQVRAGSAAARGVG